MENYQERPTHEGLFSIGEVARCCGINRQTILFYEKKGLLNATEQSPSSGYRYYSIDAITNIMEILQLRDAGLSLKDIKDYFKNGLSTTNRIINTMEKNLEQIESSLEHIRALSVEKGDYNVFTCKQPEMICCVNEYTCHSIHEAMNNMYLTYYEAIEKQICGRETHRIYAEYPGEKGDAVNLTDFLMRVYLPVKPGASGPDFRLIPAINGISVCHRGDYSQIGAAYEALWYYVRRNGLQPTGAVRECYLKSYSNCDNNTDNYLTQLILPI